MVPTHASRVGSAAVPNPAAPVRRGRSASISLGWYAVAVALLFGWFSANPLLSCAAVLSLGVIVWALRRPGHPPVLAFIGFMQWLQASLLVWQADLLGVEVRSLSAARSIEEATYLTLAWTGTLAVGAGLVVRGIPRSRLASANEHTLSVRRLLLVYLAWALLSQALLILTPAGVRQFVVALSQFRWAAVFALVIHGWSLRRGRPIVVAAIVIEVMTGFLSFFSDFKTPLYVLAIALLSAGYRPRLRHYFALGAVTLVTLYLGVIWSAIKLDYRTQLSGGQETQAVQVSTSEQVDIFLGLIGTLDADLLADGADSLVSRIEYVEYFGFVIDHVPRFRRHEEGRLWGNALAHVFLPRLLFPGKPVLESDTVVAERYTGLRLGTGRATSITIGLPAETYADVGSPWMFLIACALGLLYGTTYRFFITRRACGAFAQGIVVAMHLTLTSVGASAPKVLGGYVTAAIVAFVLWWLGWPQLAKFVRFRPHSSR